MNATAAPEQARVAAEILVERFRNQEQFIFELGTFDYDRVKLLLEVAGYSVHRHPRSTKLAVATRAEPNLAPLNRAICA